MSKKSIMLVLMLILMASPTWALGPWTHVAITQEVCEESTSWPNKKLCCEEHMDACMFGLMMADATVFHYVTNFKKYQLMHNWATDEKCFEYARDREEEAFCVGLTLHSAQDSLSHNYWVPDSVKNSKVIAEAVAHPFVESKIDDEYRQKYPNLEYDTTYYLREENIDKFCLGEDSILNRASGLDLSWECNALAGAVSKGGMYQQVFLVGPLMNYAYKAFIKVSALAPIPKWRPYEEDAKKFTRQALQDQWPILDASGKPLDPTGYDSLKLSNIGWRILSVMLIISLAVIMLLQLKRLLKK